MVLILSKQHKSGRKKPYLLLWQVQKRSRCTFHKFLSLLLLLGCLMAFYILHQKILTINFLDILCRCNTWALTSRKSPSDHGNGPPSFTISRELRHKPVDSPDSRILGYDKVWIRMQILTFWRECCLSLPPARFAKISSNCLLFLCCLCLSQKTLTPFLSIVKRRSL